MMLTTLHSSPGAPASLPAIQIYPLRPFAPAAPRPPFATLTRQAGPKPLAQPSGAKPARNYQLPKSRISALRAEFSQTEPLPWLARLISEHTAQRQRDQASVLLKQAVAQLLTLAHDEELSQRQLAQTVGLSWSSWRRIRAGQVDAIVWLPKLTAAMARLKPC